MELSITGVMRETRPFGPCLELRRTISGTLGRAVIRVHDRVTNRGNTSVPHMLLYHCNFGWPLVDEGTDIVCKVTGKPGNREMLTGFSGKAISLGNVRHHSPNTTVGVKRPHLLISTPMNRDAVIADCTIRGLELHWPFVSERNSYPGW